MAAALVLVVVVLVIRNRLREKPVSGRWRAFPERRETGRKSKLDVDGDPDLEDHFL